MTAAQRKITELKLRNIEERQTLGLMISYLIAIAGAFLVMAFI